MSQNHELARRKPSAESRFAVAIFIVAGVVAWWAITTLFPDELRQTGDWIQARFEALRR